MDKTIHNVVTKVITEFNMFLSGLEIIMESVLHSASARICLG